MLKPLLLIMGFVLFFGRIQPAIVTDIFSVQMDGIFLEKESVDLMLPSDQLFAVTPRSQFVDIEPHVSTLLLVALLVAFGTLYIGFMDD